MLERTESKSETQTIRQNIWPIRLFMSHTYTQMQLIHLFRILPKSFSIEVSHKLLFFFFLAMFIYMKNEQMKNENQIDDFGLCLL